MTPEISFSKMHIQAAEKRKQQFAGCVQTLVQFIGLINQANQVPAEGKRNATIYKSLIPHVANDDLNAFKAILSESPDYNLEVSLEGGITILMLAVAAEASSLVKYLLDQGALYDNPMPGLKESPFGLNDITFSFVNRMRIKLTPFLSAVLHETPMLPIFIDHPRMTYTSLRKALSFSEKSPRLMAVAKKLIEKKISRWPIFKKLDHIDKGYKPRELSIAGENNLLHTLIMLPRSNIIIDSCLNDPSKRAHINTLASGMTPLHVAAANMRFGVVEILLNHNANPNATFSEGFSVMRLCVYGKSAKSLKALIKAGANFTYDKAKQTELHDAVEDGFLDGVQAILDSLPDRHWQSVVGFRDKNQYTALDIAVVKGCKSIVEVFLDHKNINYELVSLANNRLKKKIKKNNLTPIQQKNLQSIKKLLSEKKSLLKKHEESKISKASISIEELMSLEDKARNNKKKKAQKSNASQDARANQPETASQASISQNTHTVFKPCSPKPLKSVLVKAAQPADKRSVSSPIEPLKPLKRSKKIKAPQQKPHPFVPWCRELKETFENLGYLPGLADEIARNEIDAAKTLRCHQQPH